MPFFIQGKVLNDLLRNRLGQLFKEALGKGALDNLARHALGRCACQVCRDLLGRNASGDHRVYVANAQLLSQATTSPAKQAAKNAGSYCCG